MLDWLAGDSLDSFGFVLDCYVANAYAAVVVNI